jgi:hypothetical protein
VSDSLSALHYLILPWNEMRCSGGTLWYLLWKSYSRRGAGTLFRVTGFRPENSVVLSTAVCARILHRHAFRPQILIWGLHYRGSLLRWGNRGMEPSGAHFSSPENPSLAVPRTLGIVGTMRTPANCLHPCGIA